MSVNDYTLDDAHNHGFDLLELYRLWHWNSCFPFAERHDEIDERIDAIKREIEERYVLLPVDSDGVPLNIGDKVDSDNREDGTVVGIEYYEDGRVQIAVRPRTWDTPTWCSPKEYRHYHKPTVEDVLHEFATVIFAAGIFPTDDNDKFTQEKIVEYAEKIREAME